MIRHEQESLGTPKEEIKGLMEGKGGKGTDWDTFLSEVADGFVRVGQMKHQLLLLNLVDINSTDDLIKSHAWVRGEIENEKKSLSNLFMCTKKRSKEFQIGRSMDRPWTRWRGHSMEYVTYPFQIATSPTLLAVH